MWLYPVPDDRHRRRDRRGAGVDVRDEDTRSQLLLSLLAWAVVLVLYCVTRWRGGSVEPDSDGRRRSRAHGATGGSSCSRTRPSARASCSTSCAASTARARRRVLRVRAGEPGRHRSGGAERARSGCGTPPSRPRAGGWTGRSASCGQTVCDAEGELGDYRPAHALEEAVGRVGPDVLVVATHPEGRSAWLRHHDIVTRARERYRIPVRHIVATAPAAVRA